MITVINEKPQMCFTIVTERFISFSYSDDERCMAGLSYVAEADLV